MDHHGAYEALLEPVRSTTYLFDEAFETVPISILAHDPDFDLARILAYRNIEPDIDFSDPRAVQNFLSSNFTARIEARDRVPQQEYLELHEKISHLPEIPTSEPWSKAERLLSKITNDRIAKAIISAVDRLATLIKEEKVASLRQPDASKPVSSSSEKFDVEPPLRRPGRDDFNV